MPEGGGVDGGEELFHRLPESGVSTSERESMCIAYLFVSRCRTGSFTRD